MLIHTLGRFFGLGAWSTLGLPGGSGEEFLGIPTSGFVNFVKDEALSTSLLNKIKANDIVRKIGRPELDIPFILFPSTT